jgi:putative CocE/NonD family hydrolase
MVLAQTPQEDGPIPPPAARYEVRVEKNYAVAMRDGVRLATDVYFPVGLEGERLPVVLLRLPYDKETYGGAIPPARFFAGQGYAVVVQDVRGKFQSEGEYLVSAADRLDGYDTVEWAANQPWSNARVGTYGCSYLGENQTQLAAMRHPAHVAAIPQAAGGSVGSAGGRYGYFGIYEGGVFGLSASFGWFRSAARKRPGGSPAPAIEVGAALRELPTIDLMNRYGPPDRETDWEEFLREPLTGEWWEALGYLRDDDRFDTPAIHVNSWYDLGANETLQQWRMMQDNAESPRARDHQYVILSPTSHCLSERATANTVVGDIDFGDARLDYWSIYLRWFDHWLKGEENGVTDMPKVQYYTLGRNEWRSADEWPIPGVRSTTLHLHSDGGANSRFGDGRLDDRAPTNETPDRFTYDPADPVPSRGGSVCCTGNPLDQPGAFDQSDIEERDDVLVYTGDPVGDGGLEITGPVSAVLHVSSDASDTDFTVKLLDVYPDGRAINVLEGIKRARFRNGYERAEFMEPGETYRIDVDLHAVSYWFAPGHRLRVEVSSSNFPRFERNLNTGGNNYDETEWRIARNVIHHTPSAPSYLVLPIVDGR